MRSTPNDRVRPHKLARPANQKARHTIQRTQKQNDQSGRDRSKPGRQHRKRHKKSVRKIRHGQKRTRSLPVRHLRREHQEHDESRPALGKSNPLVGALHDRHRIPSEIASRSRQSQNVRQTKPKLQLEQRRRGQPKARVSQTPPNPIRG